MTMKLNTENRKEHFEHESDTGSEKDSGIIHAPHA